MRGDGRAVRAGGLRAVLAGDAADVAIEPARARQGARALSAAAPVALARERAKAPYSPAQIEGFLRLAAAQSTLARRMRAGALVCLGAGAGIIAGELRHVRGSDVVARAGGVLVACRGRGRGRCRCSSATSERLLAAAAFAGERLHHRRPRTRPAQPHRHALGRAVDRPWLPRLGERPVALDVAFRVRRADRARRVHGGRRDPLQPTPRRPRRRAPRRDRGRAGRAARRRGASSAQQRSRGSSRSSTTAGVCEQIETLLPIGVRPRQLSVRTLLLGMLLVAVEGRPAHLRRVHQALHRAGRGRPAPARRARPLERPARTGSPTASSSTRSRA